MKRKGRGTQAFWWKAGDPPRPGNGDEGEGGGKSTIQARGKKRLNLKAPRSERAGKKNCRPESALYKNTAIEKRGAREQREKGSGVKKKKKNPQIREPSGEKWRGRETGQKEGGSCKAL